MDDSPFDAPRTNDLGRFFSDSGTPPGEFSQIISDAVQDETGIQPELSTSGGTSDARFLRSICPVIEFGLCNATMHKRDEAVAIADLEALAKIYRRITLAILRG